MSGEALLELVYHGREERNLVMHPVSFDLLVDLV